MNMQVKSTIEKTRKLSLGYVLESRNSDEKSIRKEKKTERKIQRSRKEFLDS